MIFAFCSHLCSYNFCFLFRSIANFVALVAMIYGNFSDLLIGIFGEVEILVDPYSEMQTGVTAVRILQAVDIKVRHAESFGAIQDITT